MECIIEREKLGRICADEKFRHITLDAQYQRGECWSVQEKRDLIRAALEGVLINPITARDLSHEHSAYRMEVIDGKQRLLNLWGFRNGEFDLGAKAEPIKGFEVKKANYHTLPDELKQAFDSLMLTFNVYKGISQDQAQTIFRYINSGKYLNGAEKRTAMGGPVRDFVRDMERHAFLSNCNLKGRSSRQALVEQITCLSIAGGPCNVTTTSLRRMHEDQRFDPYGDSATRVRRILDYLLRVFCVKSLQLTQTAAVSLYLVIATLEPAGITKGKESDIRTWFNNFESDRKASDALQKDPLLSTYEEKIGHASDSEGSIRWRHNYLMTNLEKHLPALVVATS